MSDLIERDKVIEYCLKLIDAERKQGSDVMNYGQERINQTDTIIAFVENLPSADAVSLEEFEQMRFLADKSMEMVGEPTWADVLAELHERFDALEKELRRASAEMSAIIREHVDRPKGDWIDGHGNHVPMTEHSAYCSHCGEWSEYLTDYCGNCGASMGEREDK